MSTSANKNTCFHCGLPVPDGSHYHVEIDGVEQPMCCPGCQAVAKAIVNNGLTDFYRYRTESSRNPEQILPAALQELDLYDKLELQKTFVRDEGKNIREASLILEGIVCAACVWLNEHHVGSLPGVQEFSINYSTHRARVKWDDAVIHLSDILHAITNIGYMAHPFDPGRQEQVFKRERSLALRRLVIAGLGMMQVMMLAVAMYAGESQGMDPGLNNFMRWVSLVIALPVVVYSAQPFFTAAWRSLRRYQLGMDVPVSLAIGGAFLASAWATMAGHGEIYFDSVTMFSFFLLGGRYLEMQARHRAGQVAEELVRLLPVAATRIKGGEEEVITAAELRLGDHVLIRPGEIIPADGRIVEGRSSVDESLLTGESMPCSRQTYDALIGGSLNIESPLIMQVEKLGEDTVLSAIVRLLDRAQTEKPELAQLADRVAAWFVGVLLVLASLVAWWWWRQSPTEVFQVTLSVLVVTCPCALSLATPAALVAATGSLTRRGLLTTRGHALETLARATHVIFDKTGTLTYGKLQLSDVKLLGSSNRDTCLGIAAALEGGSEHPIAKAILEKAQQVYFASEVESTPGKGIEGMVDNKKYRIGTIEYVGEIVTEPVVPATMQGMTTVVLADHSKVMAMFSFSDQPREEARDTITQMHELGLNVTLLSGDNQLAVSQIADQLGIENAHANMLPQDKLEFLRMLQQQGAIVAMVGDGVNDAPVLAGAQVSLAMGGGTQLAHASADMVLLSEHLLHIAEGIRTSRKTLTIIRQNLAWAVVYNLIALPLAAAGMVAPWMAAIGMSASSLMVVLNSLRLSGNSSE